MNKQFSAVVAQSLFIFVPLAALLAGITAWIYLDNTTRESARINQAEFGAITQLLNTVDLELNRVGADVIFLATQVETDNVDGQRKGPNVDKFANTSESLAAMDERYRQIRFVDQHGVELVRVVRRNDDATRISNIELRNVANEYSFKRAIVRTGGEVTVSPVVERKNGNKVTHVRHPILRFAAPITDGGGEKIGVVTIDYLGTRLFEQLTRSYRGPGRVLLVDSIGSFFAAPIPETTSRSGPENREEKSFGQMFPDAWTMLVGKTTGQFRSADGLFTYGNILSERQARRDDTSPAKLQRLRILEPISDVPLWRVVTHVPSNKLGAESKKLFDQLLILDAFLVLLLLNGSFFIARLSIKRKAAESNLSVTRVEQKGFDRRAKQADLLALSNTVPDLAEDNVHFIDSEISGPFSLQPRSPDTRGTFAFTKQAAYYDPMTELPNLTFFREFLDRTIARSKRYEETLVLCYVDLDDFSRINAAHGRDVGNELLKTIGRRLANSLRGSDFIAHPSINEVRLYRASHVSEIANELASLASDQFLIMLHEIKRIEYVAKIAERILRDVSMPLQLGDVAITITCSIGISILPDDGHTVESLVEKAKIAMRQTKHDGKHGYTLHGSIPSEALLTADSGVPSS